MTNLLYETIEKLVEHGKALSDVVWFGCKEFEITSEQFIELANRDYESGYGAPEVAVDLLVVGVDFWLERHEYDGSEWWEYKEIPERPKEIRNITRVIGDAWDTLSDLNDNEPQTDCAWR